MTEARFWSSTVAQLYALLPPSTPAAEAEQGDGSDLLAMVSAW